MDPIIIGLIIAALVASGFVALALKKKGETPAQAVAQVEASLPVSHVVQIIQAHIAGVTAVAQAVSAAVNPPAPIPPAPVLTAPPAPAPAVVATAPSPAINSAPPAPEVVTSSAPQAAPPVTAPPATTPTVVPAATSPFFAYAPDAQAVFDARTAENLAHPDPNAGLIDTDATFVAPINGARYKREITTKGGSITSPPFDMEARTYRNGITEGVTRGQGTATLNGVGPLAGISIALTGSNTVVPTAGKYTITFQANPDTGGIFCMQFWT